MTLNSAKQAYMVWRRVRLIKELAAVDVAWLVAKTHSVRFADFLSVLDAQLDTECRRLPSLY